MHLQSSFEQLEICKLNLDVSLVSIKFDALHSEIVYTYTTRGITHNSQFGKVVECIIV